MGEKLRIGEILSVTVIYLFFLESWHKSTTVQFWWLSTCIQLEKNCLEAECSDRLVNGSPWLVGMACFLGVIVLGSV